MYHGAEQVVGYNQFSYLCQLQGVCSQGVMIWAPGGWLKITAQDPVVTRLPCATFFAGLLQAKSIGKLAKKVENGDHMTSSLNNLQ